ncbi:MAG: transcriptional regulator [Chthoniobacterales bacterium]
MEREDGPNNLREAREEFVSQWGSIGSAWGINRTMAQIHALLMTSPKPLTTDEIMEDLRISRGNANTNLRDLVGWGLIRTVLRKGERKEYFEAEKDVWKMFCIVSRERKRREISPAMEVLQRCSEKTKGLKNPEAKDFHKQISALLDFLRLSERVLDTVAGSEQSKIVKLAAKFFT